MGKKELQFIIKYENNKRNKAILALLWDLNARNHEITLLRIKNIRLEKYVKANFLMRQTGNGPILLILSFPYIRDWLNEHPFRNEVNARLICNKENRKPLLGVVNGCSKVGVIDLPTLTPTMMNCSSSYWCIMTGEGRIKDCWFLGEKGWINFTNHMYMKCFLVDNSI